MSGVFNNSCTTTTTIVAHFVQINLVFGWNFGTTLNLMYEKASLQGGRSWGGNRNKLVLSLINFYIILRISSNITENLFYGYSQPLLC